MAGALPYVGRALGLGVFGESVKQRLALLSQRCFLAAYDTSNDYYWQREGAQPGWRRLGGLIECNAHLFGVASGASVPHYLLAIRAAPGMPLKRVEVIVKAKNSLASRKARIVIEDLGQVPVTCELPALPSPGVPLNGSAMEPYEAVHLLLVEAVSERGAHLAVGKKIMGRLTPAYRESLTEEFVARWGRYWHVGLINEEKQRLKSDLFGKIVLPAGQLWRPLTIRRFIFNLLTNELALSLTFWSKNLLNARQMRKALLAGEEHHSSMVEHPS